MSNLILKNAEEKMKKAILSLQKDLTTVRAGRANPSLLDKVQVEYYGSLTPINQVASISVPDPRSLMIQPWDKSIINAIEKAILKSELGLNPTNDGVIIRIQIPALTEERRNELVKLIKKMGEEAKVAIRNIRRDTNDEIKKIEKTKEISEDDSRRLQDEVQKLTDKQIAEVDIMIEQKEKEIKEI